MVKIMVMLDSSEADHLVVTKEDIKGLICQVVYQTEKAVEQNRPRFILGFKVRQEDGSLLREWGFFVEVGGGGSRNN